MSVHHNCLHCCAQCSTPVNTQHTMHIHHACIQFSQRGQVAGAAYPTCTNCDQISSCWQTPGQALPCAHLCASGSRCRDRLESTHHDGVNVSMSFSDTLLLQLNSNNTYCEHELARRFTHKCYIRSRTVMAAAKTVVSPKKPCSCFLGHSSAQQVHRVAVLTSGKRAAEVD